MVAVKRNLCSVYWQARVRMSVESWAAACNSSSYRPYLETQQAAAGSGYSAVAAYAVASACSAFWLAAFMKISYTDPSKAAKFWVGLKWFLLASFVGNLCGIIGWSFRTQAAHLRDIHDEQKKLGFRPPAQEFRSIAEVYATYTPYYPFRGVEFFCLCLSTLMVLHRLLKHTLDSRSNGDAGKDAGKELERSRIFTTNHHTEAGSAAMPRRSMLMQAFFSVFSFIVISFCVVGIICGLADAVFYSAQRDYSNSVFNAVTVGDKDGEKNFKAQSKTAGEFQAGSRSAQHFCEVIPLHLLIIMFAVVGRSSYLTMNASRIQLERAKQAMVEVNSADLHGNRKHSGIFKLSANVNVQAQEMADAKHMARAIVASSMKTLSMQRMRLLAAVIVVPVLAFLPRTIYGVMVLISGFSVKENPSCDSCGTCQAIGLLISKFDKKSPELQNICIAMSSPLAMIICLFLMISQKERARLLNKNLFVEDDIEKGAAIMSEKLGIELPRSS